MDTKSLVTENSSLKLVKRDGFYLVILDGEVVNTSHSLIAGQLFARGVRREIASAKFMAARKTVAA